MMASGLSASGAVMTNAELGPELPDIFTDEVGFKGVHSDSNVRFLPKPWPSDSLPTPTCSLLAVAQSRGIVVGAGPDSLTIASTEAVRKAIVQPSEDQSKTKLFKPQSTIPLPARPTHVAFCSEDEALVLATESGTHLVVFNTVNLLQGNEQPALSIPTNGATLRVVAPSPALQGEATSALVALVTMNNELLIADLKAEALVSGPNGPILKNEVSHVCWSNRGKQLVAGLVDGTGYQMTPNGTKKDEIPRPEDLQPNCHVSSIAWLENDSFLMVYTPNSLQDDMGGNPMSFYYIITKRNQAPFLIQKLSEPCSTMGGYQRTPAYQFIMHLRGYNPHLRNAIIISSTASADVGIVTRSDQPLGSDDSAKQAVGVFAVTEVNDDTKKASVPLNDSAEETSVIGLGMDLSSTENVISPISGEAISESSTPLPNILLLNNDGILSSWWFIYADSIRRKLPYPGLVSAKQAQAEQSSSISQPSFGKLSSGSPSTAIASPGFGKSSLPSFGAPSALGSGMNLPFGWPAPTASGSTTTFGAPSQLGTNVPQFGQTSLSAVQPSSFGQPSALGQGAGSRFGVSTAPSGGGFTAYANSGGFASSAALSPASGSPFGKPAESLFGQPAKPFLGLTDSTTSFVTRQITENNLGFGQARFELGSTFKSGAAVTSNDSKPEEPSPFSFGANLDEILTSPDKPSSPMDAADDMEPEPATAQVHPSYKLLPSAFTVAPKPSIPEAQPATPVSTAPVGVLVKDLTATPLSPPSEETDVNNTTLPGRTVDVIQAPVKVDEIPLLHDSASRAVYGPGDTSGSSAVSKSSTEDAPLPPDFVPAPKLDFSKETVKLPAILPEETESAPSLENESAKVLSDAAAPEDDVVNGAGPDPSQDGSGVYEVEDELDEEPEEEEANDPGFSDSGEEITHDLSEEETEANLQSPKFTPGSSFGIISNRELGLDSFSRISKTNQEKTLPQQLFSEIKKPASSVLDHGRAGRQVSSTDERRTSHKVASSRSWSRAVNANRSAGIVRRSHLSSRGFSPEQVRPRFKIPYGAEEEEEEEEDEENDEEEEEDGENEEEEKELALSDIDEDEKLRASLFAPIEPVPTLDPFLPHHDYMDEADRPGIPGQIERLYRDLNSMIYTLGINARSLASYVLYQKASEGVSFEKWINMLQSDNAAAVLEEDLRLMQIEKFDNALDALERSLQKNWMDDVRGKLERCRELLNRDMSLWEQCAGIQRTLDSYTDAVAIRHAPLSSEQANLQQDLRTASTAIQASLADLEQGISLLRTKIAEAPQPDGTTGTKQTWKRPTVEQVTSTIATMTSMAESKSSDIDILEAQLRRIGIEDPSSPSRREGSPYTVTPRRSGIKYPATPGLADSSMSAYHTPESIWGMTLGASIDGSMRRSRLRGDLTDMITEEDSERWKARAERRKYVIDNLKKAAEKKSKVRKLED